jgi:hypothetical protein
MPQVVDTEELGICGGDVSVQEFNGLERAFVKPDQHLGSMHTKNIGE